MTTSGRQSRLRNANDVVHITASFDEPGSSQTSTINLPCRVINSFLLSDYIEKTCSARRKGCGVLLNVYIHITAILDARSCRLLVADGACGEMGLLALFLYSPLRYLECTGIN